MTEPIAGQDERRLFVRLKTRAMCFFEGCGKPATMRVHYLLPKCTMNLRSVCHNMSPSDITAYHSDWERFTCELHRQAEMDTRTPQKLDRNTSLRLAAGSQHLFLLDVEEEVKGNLADEFFVAYDDAMEVEPDGGLPDESIKATGGDPGEGVSLEEQPSNDGLAPAVQSVHGDGGGEQPAPTSIADTGATESADNADGEGA